MIYWQQIPPPQLEGISFPEKAQNALFDIKKFLDYLRVPFCLGHGTLLGIYRDGNLLPRDSDVDVMLPWSVDRVWLAGELEKLGCTMTTAPQNISGIEGQWNLAVMMPPDDIVVEISFLKPENGKVWFGFTRGEHVIKLPVSPFGFASVKYHGIEFPIPSPCDKHLCEIYGEGWNKRTRNRNFFIINPNVVDDGNIRICYALNHIVGAIGEGNYKKAQGYTEQLLSIYDDPLLLQLREYFAALPYTISFYEPLVWQEKRMSWGG